MKAPQMPCNWTNVEYGIFAEHVDLDHLSPYLNIQADERLLPHYVINEGVREYVPLAVWRLVSNTIIKDYEPFNDHIQTIVDRLESSRDRIDTLLQRSDMMIIGSIWISRIADVGGVTIDPTLFSRFCRLCHRVDLRFETFEPTGDDDE